MGSGSVRSGPDRHAPLAALVSLAGMALLICTLASPAPAAAQGVDAPPTDGGATGEDGATGRLEATAGAVLLTPLADLTPGGELGGGLQLSSSVGVRGSGLWRLGPRLAVGVSGSWVPVDVERLDATTPEGDPVPGDKVADADFLTAGLEATLALSPMGAGVQVEPFLVGGVGLRRLSTEGSIEGAPSATDPLVSFGGGFRTLLSDRWHLRLEARDHLSVYEGADGDRTQHDLAVSVGLGVRP